MSWYPPHIKHGRFGDWLANNVDWALSRERYWGTPLPVWRCPEGHVHVIGSFAELRERSGVELDDPHRPYVDEVRFPCPECEQAMTRVPEVIDVWFDSGSMPFAQHHAPFENEERLRDEFPADFICEALDQTRGWFYSLLAVSTLLFDRAPYENVVCLGLILDGEGQKMSKSRGNAVEPWEVIDTYGADALRWYFFTSKQPWDGYRFAPEAIGEGVRRVPAPAVEHVLLLRPVRAGQRRRVRRRRRRGGLRRGPRCLGALAPHRHGASRWPSGSTPTTRPPPGARSPSSSTTSPTGTCAAHAPASGPATATPSRRCATAS